MIVPSQFVRRRAIELLGMPPERVHAIPWGVDHDRFRPGDEEREPFLLYPARPWPHKNHARLFEAFALLREERPELRLVLTGGGHEGRPVPPGVEVRGHVAGEELASLYRRAACLVFPSLYEGFGQPPLEAMASGTPVAASNIPAIAEACGDAAALFDPSEPGGHRGRRLGRAREPRPFRRRRPRARAPASPGRRPPADTRPSTVGSRRHVVAHGAAPARPRAAPRAAPGRRALSSSAERPPRGRPSCASA